MSPAEDQITFTPCAVAFLDILGFKDFIAKAEDRHSLEFAQFSRLLDIRSAPIFPIDQYYPQQHQFPRDIGLRCLAISDSFILSAPTGQPYSGLVAVSIRAIQLAHQLLRVGLLLRGGIAVGIVHRTTSDIFGTGYLNAYATEQVAQTPRILLHRTALAELEASHFGWRIGELSIVMKEGDDFMLDTLNAHRSYICDDRDLLAIYSDYRTRITEKLESLPHGPRREKWEWMARLFNAKRIHDSQLHGVCPINIEEHSPLSFAQASGPTTFEEAFGRFMTPPKHVETHGPKGKR